MGTRTGLWNIDWIIPGWADDNEFMRYIMAVNIDFESSDNESPKFEAIQ